VREKHITQATLFSYSKLFLRKENIDDPRDERHNRQAHRDDEDDQLRQQVPDHHAQNNEKEQNLNENGDDGTSQQVSAGVLG
jgi:hypothetical protein